MKNKQHEYILKAFLKSSIPAIIHRREPELLAIDSVIGGYCTQLIKKSKFIEIASDAIISKTEKDTFSEMINCSSGKEKDELVLYWNQYRPK